MGPWEWTKNVDACVLCECSLEIIYLREGAQRPDGQDDATCGCQPVSAPQSTSEEYLNSSMS